MPTTSIVSVLLVCCMALAACGSRVVPLDAAQAQLGPGSGSESLTPDVPAGSLDPAPGATGAPQAGPTQGTGGDPLPNCRGGATDVGVTARTVKLGLVASLTGPLPGQFDSAVEATDSYVRMINDSGGICGRRLQLLIRDDNGNGNTNLAVAQKLAEEDEVFAFVGSVSAPDDSGIAKISKQRRIPDIGFPLTWTRAESPYTYGTPGQLQRSTIGDGASGSKYLNEIHGIKQIAIFWLRESEVSILNAWAFESAMMKNSRNTLKICHEQPAGVLDNNYTNYVVSMIGKCDPADGPIAVYSTMENNANIKLAIAMRDQGFTPALFAPTFTSYLPSFIEQARGSTEGAYIAMPVLPVERLQRPRSEWTPGTFELQRYMQALQRYHPRHKPPGSFGGPGWGAAALFVETMRRCGADLTRACILRELERMEPFTANGFLSPTRPRDRHIYTQDLIVQVRNGRFEEIRPTDRSGPETAPDFWDRGTLMDWQKYFCANQRYFPRAEEKKRLIDAC